MNESFDRSDIRIPPQVNMLPVSGGALRVLVAICRFANKSLSCTVGRERLLMYLPFSDKRNLGRSVRELVTGGFLEVKHNSDRRTSATRWNTYRLKIPSLKKIREIRHADKCAGGGVKRFPLRVSKRVISRAPIRNELNQENLNHGHGYVEPIPRVSGGGGNFQGDVRRALEFFGRLYRAKTGNVFVPKALDRHVIGGLVRSGAHGLAATMACCELWFNDGAQWAERARRAGYALPGSADPGPGMEWHVEWIMSLPSYDDRKRAHAARLHA